jgi:flagellar basal-body rod protein FlgF
MSEKRFGQKRTRLCGIYTIYISHSPYLPKISQLYFTKVSLPTLRYIVGNNQGKKVVSGVLRSLYISASGMLAQRRTMDVLSNNLANLDTIGFKRDNLMSRSFSDMLIGRINDPESNSSNIGKLSMGIHADEIATDFEQGPMVGTARTADLALAGDGFFVVETPQGLRFTRSGNFQVDSSGYLCTQEGYYVRSATGRIKVGSQDFSADQNGTIKSAAGTFKLQIVKFTDNSVLRKVGSNLYAGPGTAQNATCAVQQGYLEGSNVDLSTEMVNMISVSRNYESNQRMVTMLNDTLEKTVNEVGRV